MIREFLLNHAASDPVSFHMPGHKGTQIFYKYGYGDFLERIADCDITEIPGADNLFQAEGIILKTQEKYARLYGAGRSYLLVNGTSGGIIASILASVRSGHKLIMARNCHKSVFNALRLGGIEPVYAQPKLIDKYGIMGEVAPEEIERCLRAEPDADAVILPSPNYYGICSDIASIARIVHEAGKILIVDQAHGAHLKFFHAFGQGESMPEAAEDCGADLVINSIHKTLASVTQSAVLNLQGDRVCRYDLEDRLQMIQSTSPSYIMMGFLDLNADLLLEHGQEAFRLWREALDHFYDRAKAVPGLQVIRPESAYFDLTKINLDMSGPGLNGAQLEKELIARGIWPELYAGNLLMLMTGIGNTMEDMDRTLKALHEISKAAPAAAADGNAPAANVSGNTAPLPGRLHPLPGDSEFIPLSSAAGRVCAGSIIPYPPGIPLVCPGEEITEEIIRYLISLRSAGEKVIGINDKGQILAGKDL